MLSLCKNSALALQQRRFDDSILVMALPWRFFHDSVLQDGSFIQRHFVNNGALSQGKQVRPTVHEGNVRYVASV